MGDFTHKIFKNSDKESLFTVFTTNDSSEIHPQEILNDFYNQIKPIKK